MTRERTVEIGGEILKVGGTVKVYTGRSSLDAEILRIGTKRIYLKLHGRETPFSLETRKDCENDYGYAPYFRTHTEVKQRLKRNTLLTELRDLGIQDASGNDLEDYPDEALEEIIAVLRKYRSAKAVLDLA